MTERENQLPKVCPVTFANTHTKRSKKVLKKLNAFLLTKFDDSKTKDFSTEKLKKVIYLELNHINFLLFLVTLFLFNLFYMPTQVSPTFFPPLPSPFFLSTQASGNQETLAY